MLREQIAHWNYFMRSGIKGLLDALYFSIMRKSFPSPLLQYIVSCISRLSFISLYLWGIDTQPDPGFPRHCVDFLSSARFPPVSWEEFLWGEELAYNHDCIHRQSLAGITVAISIPHTGAGLAATLMLNHYHVPYGASVRSGHLLFSLTSSWCKGRFW